MKNKILEYSYKNNLAHIPSALSMIDYIEATFEHITRDDFIILGKPFGAQAYYILWKELGWLDNIDDLHVGVKHDEIDFIDYSEETIGNALGVAIGIAMTTDKNVYVNITDASLQMGNTLEAIQFIGQHQLKNIFVTIDNNDAQVTGKTSDIIDTKPVMQLFKEYNWKVYSAPGHEKGYISKLVEKALKQQRPSVIYCNTIKGKGIKEMERNIKEWHYKKIESNTELQSLVRELQDT